MSFAELCAHLVGEPYRLSLAQIGTLDDYQLGSVYGYPRDEHGKPLPSGSGPAQTYQDEFFERFFQRGLGRARVAERWREFLALEKRRDREGG